MIGQIPAWHKEEGDQYENVSRMYSAVTGQFNRYMGHVAANIGGRFITNKSIEEAGPKYEPVPKARQKRALNFLNEQVFNKPAWLVDVPYIFNITDRPDNNLYPIVNSVVSALVSTAKLDRMEQFAQYGPGNYTPEEYLEDLYGMVFTELDKGGKADSYRRYLQQRYVTTALNVVKSDASANSGSRALLLGQLLEIQKKAAKGKGRDAATKAHWLSIANQIEKGLK